MFFIMDVSNSVKSLKSKTNSKYFFLYKSISANIILFLKNRTFEPIAIELPVDFILSRDSSVYKSPLSDIISTEPSLLIITISPEISTLSFIVENLCLKLIFLGLARTFFKS